MATDKEANARLIKKYGINLDDYEDMLRDQGGGCAICGREPTTKRLHVDHDHAFDRVKLVSVKTDGRWVTTTPLGFVPRTRVSGDTKAVTVKAVRGRLKRLSVRGLLDWKCNTALQKFQDNPDKMEAAAQYLRKFTDQYKEK